MTSFSPNHFGHVGVLMGGYSSEREISLKSGQAIYEALSNGAGLNVTAIDIIDRDESKIGETLRRHRLDMAFIALHGELGEDGTIQSILEKLNIAYTGSNTQASRLAISKASTQKLLKQNGLRVPSYTIANKKHKVGFNDVSKLLGALPWVVKPSSEGSSIGVALVNQEKEFEAALENAFGYGDEVIIESYIKGREMTVGILGEEALPIIEICAKQSFFNFNAKYQSTETQYIVPAEIPAAMAREICEMALKAFHVLGCSDMARVDFMLDEQLNPFILEVNTIPGFTSTSLLPKAAKQRGYTFSGLCLKILELSYGKKKAGHGTAVGR